MGLTIFLLLSSLGFYILLIFLFGRYLLCRSRQKRHYICVDPICKAQGVCPLHASRSDLHGKNK